jgi:predicted transcriptional regulator
MIGRGTRGYMEIVYSMLSACLNGSLRTHIMFRCNLNSKQLQFYLESLLEKGLVEKVRDPPSSKVEYKTTARGMKYMETYHTLLEMLSQARSLERGPTPSYPAAFAER